MWKKQQTDRRITKNYKLALLALVLLVLLIVLGRFINFFVGLTQPLHLSSTAQRTYTLEDNVTINTLFVSLKNPSEPKIYLVSYSPQDTAVIVLSIANDIYTSLPQDRGQWRVGSIYQLGQENSPSAGISLLKQSVSKLVGLPIDGIMIHDKLEDQTPQDIIGELRRNPVAHMQLLSGLKTDFSVIETIKVLSALSSVRANKITNLNLATSAITESKLLPDSTRVLGINVVKLDTFIQDKMVDPALVDESKTVAIFNATAHPGLAQEASRFITNMGGNVIIVQSLDTQYEKSMVISKEDSITSLRLKQFFATDCIKVPCQSNDPKITNSRSNITIVIGEDFYNYWHKPVGQ